MNLGPAQRETSAAQFAVTILETETRHFVFLRWAKALALARKKAVMPADVEEFFRKRELEGRWG